MEQTTYNKVLVGILHQGWIRPELAVVCGQMSSQGASIFLTDKKPSENNRNSLVKKMLDEGYDYLITIDHDIVPRKNPLELVSLGLDVVGAACPQWNMSDPSFPIYFVGMDRVEDGYKEHKEKDGLQEVDAVGSGCLVLSRKVLEEVQEPFVRKWRDGFATTGLDFYFCEKAKDKGFKVYCHYDYLASHFKELDLLDVLNFKYA